MSRAFTLHSNTDYFEFIFPCVCFLHTFLSLFSLLLLQLTVFEICLTFYLPLSSILIPPLTPSFSLELVIWFFVSFGEHTFFFHFHISVSFFFFSLPTKVEYTDAVLHRIKKMYQIRNKSWQERAELDTEMGVGFFLIHGANFPH